MKIFKNLLKLAKLSAIRPVFTSKTFYSAAISLVLMAPLQRRGLVATLRVAARPCNRGGGEKKESGFRVCAL
jgi:hypothetical protein